MLFVNDEVVRKRELIDFNENNIVIVEDLFGRSNIDFNEDLHRGILDVLHSCIKSESCKSKLIFTIQGNDKIKRKLVENHNIFEKDVFINLDEALSVHCKKIILSKHMNKHGISLCDCIQFETWSQTLPSLVVKRCLKDVFETKDNSMKVCVSFFHNICQGNYEIQIGFPQARHLFCSNKNLTKQGMAYFRHTSQSLVDEMNHLKIQGFDNKQIQYQFCVLVYTAMKNSINFHDIDEKCFQNVVSCIYGESHQVKMSLLKAAVLMLEGKYISRKSASSTSEQCKRPKISDHYVLQHYTIQEAVLISYGEDADILTFCDFSFLQEYIRPKGYIDELSDSMVLSFIDYKPLVKRLISMLSIDDNTCTGVGRYLKVVALLHRRDEIIQFFFQNIKDVKPEQYTRLVNGLTNFGKNGALVDFHSQLCREVMMHAGLTVFLAFCRPIGWVDNDTSFVEMETDFLIKTLLKSFSRLDENGQESKENISEYFRCFSFLKLGLGYNLYAVGDYVFKKLMEKGFVNIVELFLTNLKTKYIAN
ncbi:unnamed protein product [Mytilus coruscus]|uniref:Uncharacterized protein n=1 Tax=Mytilus coruscus TaxID=42192 RepID=A0A6J8AN57_MYTCO|nr:unnamed protein product [Mytilus coruscus]